MSMVMEAAGIKCFLAALGVDDVRRIVWWNASSFFLWVMLLLSVCKFIEAANGYQLVRDWTQLCLSGMNCELCLYFLERGAHGW